MPPILNRFTKSLSCDLTEKELLEAGKQLAATMQEIGYEEARQESLRRDMKSRLSTLETKRMDLCNNVTRGIEYREVEVHLHADYEKGIAIEIRQDTYEVVRTRPLNPDEMQVPIPEAPPEAGPPAQEEAPAPVSQDTLEGIAEADEQVRKMNLETGSNVVSTISRPETVDKKKGRRGKH